MNAKFYMQMAIKEAVMAMDHGDVPVGVVIVKNDFVIAKAHNQVELLKDPTAHAEILAITQASEALSEKRLTGCDLYVTLEPCPMCVGAIIHARIRSVYYGAHDPKMGACGSCVDLAAAPRLNHQINFSSGWEAESSQTLLKEFFKSIRK